MNTQSIPTNAPRAETETLVVAKTDEGYRVCSPLNPAMQFVVKDTGDDMTCTCPDFAANSGDPDWCCKHINAVHRFMGSPNGPPEEKRAGAVPSNGAPASKDPPPKKGGARSAEASMLLKRSLSPDGRIDSLSVEFSLPVGKLTSEEIKQHADRALKLQAEITQGFFRPNGNGSVHRNGAEARVPEAVPAHLLNIASMDTRKGRSLVINVFVGNQMAKLFGGKKELGEALASAGYPDAAKSVADGMALNLPCRAVTKQNGKYLNIERLLPAGNGGAS